MRSIPIRSRTSRGRAGFTTDNLPAGITFMERLYDEWTLIKLAYAYEQATRPRKPPTTTPMLPGEP